MMKLTLSAEAEDVIKQISPKVRAANRYSGKSASALVSAMIVEIEPTLTPALISAIAAKLVSRAGRKKALLTTLARVAQTADERQLRRLENQLQRLQAGKEVTESAPVVEENSTPQTSLQGSGDTR